MPSKKKPNFEIGQTVTNHDGDWIVTATGLPNTCSISGQPVEDGYWLARNEDAARSGQGISEEAFRQLAPPLQAVEMKDFLSEPPANDSPPVTAITGIGPATAKKLHTVYVYSVADLLALDDKTIVLEATGVSEDTLAEWVATAEELRG